jgi:hypothetical protein
MPSREPYRTDLEQVASRMLDKTQRAIGIYNSFLKREKDYQLSDG